jgi:hypothetical protein
LGWKSGFKNIIQLKAFVSKNIPFMYLSDSSASAFIFIISLGKPPNRMSAVGRKKKAKYQCRYSYVRCTRIRVFELYQSRIFWRSDFSLHIVCLTKLVETTYGQREKPKFYLCICEIIPFQVNQYESHSIPLNNNWYGKPLKPDT